jgi:hypothetical protein
MRDLRPALSAERRAGDRRVDPEALSREYLAMLRLCGGETRTGDGSSASWTGAKQSDRRQRQDL